MDNRREFIKKAAILMGATGLAGALPPSIQRALAIDPATNSTWLDAEHVVILMQENRSFDHCFGKLRGVRGYRDPRAVSLPDGNPVWLQRNTAGEIFTPFRLDIRDTKATWMGSLPHSWSNQQDARNDGRYDQWLQAKPSGKPEYAHMPLTLGYYDRRDIPFYYSLADAFTVCDQNFCSSLTGTTPNRLFLWTGTIRDEQKADVRARVRNEDTDYGVEASWTTFPERLEAAGIDWRIYQNELSIYQGFEGEEDAWLSSFTDNPIEWFSQYKVRFSPAYMGYLPQLIVKLRKEIDEVQKKIADLPADEKDGKEAQGLQRRLARQQVLLRVVEKDQSTITPGSWARQDEKTKDLHDRAFTRNSKDPDFHTLTTYQYQDGATSREMKAPKGDVLHQFREDVQTGKLPTVSWLVAPENFSDHPGAPWYGAWFVSEVLDILTQNPEVWKKTIFVLCYDENDGYFDHVPPFVAPDPSRPETGKVSAGIDVGVEYQTLEQDRKRSSNKDARGGPVGLGYRVPLVIASPWSRGGYVNSQVSDHTSILQMLEVFLSHKTGKPIHETNISEWRRTVCGDLSSVFRPYKGGRIDLPAFLGKDTVLQSINQAQYRDLPADYRSLTATEIESVRRDGHRSPLLPEQERGTRPSCALPYELYAIGQLSEDKRFFTIRLSTGVNSTGAPFTLYMHSHSLTVRNYAVKTGDTVMDNIPLDAFADGIYDIRVYGPNGFYRAFTGSKDDPGVAPGQAYFGEIRDNAYGHKPKKIKLASPISPRLIDIQLDVWDTTAQGGWYDLTLRVDGHEHYSIRFAGRVETGSDSISDPAMA